MSKNQTIEKLLKGSIKETPVVYDGIVDESRFESRDSKRIAFLLKDVNGTMSSEKSINYEANPSFIRVTKERADEQKQNPDNWKSLCYWTEAFKNPEKSFVDAHNCGENLLEIAIVNIKKTPGKGVANDKELKAAVEKYGAVIKEELDIIAPKIVFCGGTYDYAKLIYDEADYFCREDTLNTGTKYFATKSGIKFVEFVHPAVRVTLAATYAYAKEVARELRHYRTKNGRNLHKIML